MKMRDFMEKYSKYEVIFGRREKEEKGSCSNFSSCNDSIISELKRGKSVTIIQRIGYY